MDKLFVFLTKDGSQLQGFRREYVMVDAFDSRCKMSCSAQDTEDDDVRSAMPETVADIKLDKRSVRDDRSRPNA